MNTGQAWLGLISALAGLVIAILVIVWMVIQLGTTRAVLAAIGLMLAGGLMLFGWLCVVYALRYPNEQ